jgi:ubiquinone/menaquinone biosynthesis C-methylase UbiE
MQEPTPLTHAAEQSLVPNTNGNVLQWAFGYDLLVRLFWRGGEQVFREMALDLAGLQPGESVLDVGCGTGTLALAAKQHVGPQGVVCGIVASPEMIVWARKKARRNAIEVNFESAVVEKLPFADGTFDAAFSTLMLHHLGRKARQQCLCEIRRVLKPSGRVLAIDFGEPVRGGRSLLARLHCHGYIKFPDLMRMLNEAGFPTVETGSLGSRDLHYAKAVLPCGA